MCWVEDMSWSGAQEPGVSLPGSPGPPVALVSPVEHVQQPGPVTKVSQASPGPELSNQGRDQVPK